MRKKIREFENFASQNTQRFVSIKLISSSLNDISNIINDRQLNWKIKIVTKNENKKIKCLTNINASFSSFIKKIFVKQHNIFQIKLTQFINLKLINDSFVKQITHAIKIKIIFEKHKKQLWNLVIDIFDYDIIFDESWLKKHDFQINHKNRIMTFNSKHCYVNCNSFFETITISNFNFKFHRKKKHKKNKQFTIEKCIRDVDIIHISIYVYFKMFCKKKWNNRFVTRTFWNFQTIVKKKTNICWLTFSLRKLLS